MANAIIRPELERSLVVRRGSFTVPSMMATVNCDCALGLPCSGLALNLLAIEHRPLELIARERAKRMRDKLGRRGQELQGDLMLHGPWVSYDWEANLADIDSSVWWNAREKDREWGRYADPQGIANLVFERDPRKPLSDYLLVGRFLVRNVWTEVIVKDED